MELGIVGKHALVCGASRGLGLACATALAREGARVTLVARNRLNLDAAVQQINAARPAFEGDGVSANLSIAAERTALVAAVGPVDILINNAGGPPPGVWQSWTREEWLSAFDANMLSAASLIQAFVPHMTSQRFGRIVNITSITVKMPQAGLGLSTGARLALTGFVSSIAAELAASNITINNLLPGYFDTDRMRSALASGRVGTGVFADSDPTGSTRAAIPARRFGNPAEFGDFCAFLCGVQSGYVTGQNILLDGGLFRGIA